MTTITLPARLNEREVLPFPENASGKCVVDARGLAFVEPMGLVQLALLLHRLAAICPDIVFLAPGLDLHAYLWRMDFYRHIPQSVQVQSGHDVSGYNRADRGDVLVALRHFQTYIDVEELDQHVFTYLKGLKLPPPVYRVLRVAIPELCDNVTSHSRSTCGGFLAAQTYGTARHYMAVGDLGIGIHRHLTGNPAFAHIKTDEEAIEKALEPDVTGTRDRRGWGLPEIVESLKETRAANLLIRSGTGWARVSAGKGRVTKRKGTRGDVNFPGTIVQLAIREP